MNLSYNKFIADVGIICTISLIFPIFFFIITVLVSMTSITRIVEEQSLQIGTLRSLGYSGE